LLISSFIFSNHTGLPREKSKLKDFGTQRHGSFQLVPTEEMPMGKKVIYHKFSLKPWSSLIRRLD